MPMNLTIINAMIELEYYRSSSGKQKKEFNQRNLVRVLMVRGSARISGRLVDAASQLVAEVSPYHIAAIHHDSMHETQFPKRFSIRNLLKARKKLTKCQQILNSMNVLSSSKELNAITNDVFFHPQRLIKVSVCIYGG